MSERIEGWKRQREPFWRAHHDAWKRSDLNQREYCAATWIAAEGVRQLARSIQSRAGAVGA